MTQALRIFDKHNRDITDNFDEDGILKDKHSMRVPLTMRDHDGNVVDTKRRKGTQFDPNGLISHTWEETTEEDSAPTMQDALDHMAAGKAKRDAQIRDSARIKDEARAEMIKDTANAWKTHDGDPDPFVRALVKRGVVEKFAEQWKHEPEAAATDARDEAWRQMVSDQNNAWKENQ